MKKLRVGIIDNLDNIDSFNKKILAYATAQQIMSATGGNTGNIAFVYGLQSLIAHQYTRISWDTPVDFIQKEIDIILISCANQLGSHVSLNYWADRLQQFNKPVALIGIGAQSDSSLIKPQIPTGTLDFLKIVDELRPNGAINITTRGEFTSSILKDLGFKSLPLGCPSLHISPENDLGGAILKFQNKTKFEKICVSAGNPWHEKSSKLEKILTDIVDQFLGAYILQHDESMIALAIGDNANLKPNQISTYLNAYCDKFSLTELTDWYRRNAVFFTDVGSWIQFYKRFDCIVGPRYHGVALGIQACRPGTVVTIDSRTEELCNETGVKQIDINTALKLSKNELIEASHWTLGDAINLSTKKEIKRIAYKDFFESIGI